MQSLFGLNRIELTEHNEPPRCIISASRLVRAIDVTNKNKFRSVGVGLRFTFRYMLFVISSIARPIASDNFVDIWRERKTTVD